MDPSKQNDPGAVLAEINGLLAQAVFLSLHYESLTGVRLRGIPDSVGETSAAPGELTYGQNGLTQPRADGAVRSRAWDAAVDRALASDDPAERAWGAANAARRWIFIQDTLAVAGITALQAAAIKLNCANARFMNGLLGRGDRFASWKASPLADGDSERLADAEITDAFALSSDMTRRDGTVVWTGIRAGDIDTVAKRSLAHYIMTSGRATKPISQAQFGGAKK